MPLFKKKPVVVEARQFIGTATSARAICDWSNGTVTGPFDEDVQPYIMVKTLEGVMRVDPGDWVVKGVAHEFYPVKPDIFGFTYEPIEEVTDVDPEPDPRQAHGREGDDLVSRL